MKVLGLIPARGGSKGIPNKNRKQLGGKPLLQYTIEAALGSKLLDAVVFSSEDDVLIDLAGQMGASVPFKRPAHLATDAAGSLAVVQHALEELSKNGETFDAVCLLQVTTPFRNSEDIDRAITAFITEGADALISVQKVPHQYNPHWVFEKVDGNLKIATGEKEIIKRRQELPKAFVRDGSIYLTKSYVILEENSFFADRLSYIELDPKRHVNIDTYGDWQRAEELANLLCK